MTSKTLEQRVASLEARVKEWSPLFTALDNRITAVNSKMDGVERSLIERQSFLDRMRIPTTNSRVIFAGDEHPVNVYDSCFGENVVIRLTGCPFHSYQARSRIVDSAGAVTVATYSGQIQAWGGADIAVGTQLDVSEDLPTPNALCQFWHVVSPLPLSADDLAGRHKTVEFHWRSAFCWPDKS